MKKQVTGEDADLEKAGCILNRVIEVATASRGGSETRETLKDLKKNENTAGIDGSKGENQREQGQRQIEHDRDDAGDGDDENKLQMTNVTGGDITKYRALVARISYLSQDPTRSQVCAATQVCCAMASPPVSDLERVKRIGMYFLEKPRAECLFRWQQTGQLEAHSDAGGVRKCGPRSSRWCPCPLSELYAAVKTASEGLGIQSVAKDLGIACGLNLHLDATATMGLANRKGLGTSTCRACGY